MPLFDQIEHADRTDIGIRRSHNQDNKTTQPAKDLETWARVGHLYCVADGMGGHAVGEKASERAVQEIPLTYSKYVSIEGPLRALRRAVENANAEIHAIGESVPEFRGLGTTASVLVLREEGAWIAHVGDSRVYRIRDGKIEQLSFDHSYVWEMARRLRIPPEELSDIKKNVIVRSLGPDVSVQVDIEGPHPLQTGDSFILCSDGLSNMVSPEEMGAIVAALPLQESTEFLIQLANLRGGPDNITVIAVRLGSVDPSVSTKIIRPPNPLYLLARNIWYSWNRFLPWPLTVLILGFIFAICFVIYKVLDISGSMLMAILGSVCIATGLAGLILQARWDSRKEDAPAGKPRKLNIYRTHPCPVQPGLIEKFRRMEEQVSEILKTQKVTDVDWKRWQQHHDAAQRSLKESDLVLAFRETCRALKILATTFNSSRKKDESFTPKWETG